MEELRLTSVADNATEAREDARELAFEPAFDGGFEDIFIRKSEKAAYFTRSRVSLPFSFQTLRTSIIDHNE
jgi:hypothetical protein